MNKFFWEIGFVSDVVVNSKQCLSAIRRYFLPIQASHFDSFCPN